MVYQHQLLVFKFSRLKLFHVIFCLLDFKVQFYKLLFWMITFLLHPQIFLHVFLYLLCYSMLRLQLFDHPNFICLIILQLHNSLYIITAFQLISHRVNFLFIKSHCCFTLPQLLFLQLNQRVFIINRHSMIKTRQTTSLLLISIVFFTTSQIYKLF